MESSNRLAPLYKDSRLWAAMGINGGLSEFYMVQVLHSGVHRSLVPQSSASRQFFRRLFSLGRGNKGHLQWRGKDSTAGGDIAAGSNSEPSSDSNALAEMGSELGNQKRLHRRVKVNKTAQSQSWSSTKSPFGTGISHSTVGFSSKYKRRLRLDLKEQRHEHPILNSGVHDAERQLDEHFAQSQSRDGGRVTRAKESRFGKRLTPANSRERRIKPFDICSPLTRNLRLNRKYNSCFNGEGGECLSETAQTVEDARQVLRPGMVVLKNYLTDQEQLDIVKTCWHLGLGPGGFYQPRYPDGARLRLQMMCLGLNWDPVTRKYEDQRPFDGCKPPDIPSDFCLLVKRAMEDAHELIKRSDIRVHGSEEILPAMSPNICIVNFYTANGRLGLHQDRDESRESLQRGLPVVSLSVGDSAEFLYGDDRDVEKAEKVVLDSGDILIFGGKSRMVFHGVSSIIPNSAPAALLHEASLRPGRLNLTFRQF